MYKSKGWGSWRWVQGRPVVARAEVVENAVHIRSLQGRHSDRSPGQKLARDVRAPDYTGISGSPAIFAATCVLGRRRVGKLLGQMGDLVKHDEVDKDVATLCLQIIRGSAATEPVGHRPGEICLHYMHWRQMIVAAVGRQHC